MKRLISTIGLLVCLLFAGCGVPTVPAATETAAPSAPVIQSLPSSSDDRVHPSQLPEDSAFAVHFIDVGQADAALILCDGESMLIDGGNVEDSSRIAAYLKKWGVTHLNYIVSTHPHEDHVGGLAGALNVCTADHILSPVQTYDTEAFDAFAKYAAKRGVGLTRPEPGETYALGSSVVQILGPADPLSSDVNNWSIVLRITYGETSFLFTGDAEREVEQELLASGYDLESTVLKVGHHGSETSTSYVFLREVMPRYGVISVGADNTYGHPSEAVLSRLRDADVAVYRTDLQGDIVMESDGKTVRVQTQKNGADAQPTGGGPVAEEGTYIGNLNSKKFHRPTCGSLPAEKNQVFFDSRAEAVEQGYVPCKRCNP
jgi:competence protein ComEC